MCRRENHRRQCKRWNRSNRDYFKANYLSGKLSRTKDPLGARRGKAPVAILPSRIELCLPKDVVADIIGAQPLIILEYIIAQIMSYAKVRASVRAP
jgi:hypothetical protein